MRVADVPGWKDRPNYRITRQDRSLPGTPAIKSMAAGYRNAQKRRSTLRHLLSTDKSERAFHTRSPLFSATPKACVDGWKRKIGIALHRVNPRESRFDGMDRGARIRAQGALQQRSSSVPTWPGSAAAFLVLLPQGHGSLRPTFRPCRIVPGCNSSSRCRLISHRSTGTVLSSSSLCRKVRGVRSAAGLSESRRAVSVWNKTFDAGSVSNQRSHSCFLSLVPSMNA